MKPIVDVSEFSDVTVYEASDPFLGPAAIEYPAQRLANRDKWLYDHLGGAQPAGMSTTLYVDKGGDDGTAARGSLALKYLTVAAAFAAAQSGDTVQCGPGTWNETLIWPDIASGRLVGQGYLTKITSSSAVTITRSSAAALSKLIIQDMIVESKHVAGIAVGVSGAAAGGYALSAASGEQIKLERVALIGASKVAALNCAGVVELVDVLGSGGELELTECGSITATNVHAEPSVRWSIAETEPTGYASCSMSAASCVFSGATGLTGVIEAEFDGACIIGTVAATLSENVGGTHGSLRANCPMGAITASGNSAGPVAIAVLDGSTVDSISVTAAGAGRCSVSLRGGVVRQAIAVDALSDLDLRGTTHDAAEYAVAAGGTINRSQWSAEVNLANGVNNITFATPYTTAPDFVVVSPNTGGLTVATGAPTATGVTIVISGADAAARVGVLQGG